MNKKEAISYAQITLDNMLSLEFKKELTLQNFEKIMKEVFKTYSRKTAIQIAKAKVYAEEQLQILREQKNNL